MIKAGRTHGIIARNAQGNPLLNAKGNTYFPKSDFRAHHVIPHEVWTENQDFFDDISLGKKASHARINRDGTRVHNPKGYNPKGLPANGMYLSKDEATGINHKFDQYHSGGHPQTIDDMRVSVGQTRTRFENGIITKTQARKEISALQKAERKRLSRRSGGGCTIMP